MVFNDPRLGNHFDHKIWLTVSDQFDKLKLTKEMLTDVCRTFSTMNSRFNNLQKELETGLDSKKILLVLDDVWCAKDENHKYTYQKEWLDFLAPLNNTKAGSKIMMTSRQGLESSIFGSERSISVLGLNVNDSWSVFDLCAFNGKNEYKRHELEPIGKEIVNRLKGHSLAIRVVGTQLRGNSDVEEWKKTLSDNLLDAGDIMKILHRSYEHLPEHLKRCFAYCSLFPKDYRLKPGRLIQMWIAHGFVRSDNRMKLEDVGKSYFKALLARSFFQVMTKSNKEYYVMHDLMNDLACHVSKGECYILDKDNSMINLGSVRHLSVTHGAIGNLKNMHGLDKLCTLMLLFDANRHREDINNLFSMLKRIRVLDVEWKIENLCEVSQCKHLHYLSVRHSDYSWLLPDSLAKLHLLRTLIIRKEFHSYQEYESYRELTFPKSLCSMSSLKLVDISKRMIVLVRELVPPQTLWKGGSASLHVENKKKGHRLDLLGDINNIKGYLGISGLQNATCKEEAVKAKLSKKEHVSKLDMSWENSPMEVESSKYHAVLEALSPNPNLKVLSVIGYPGAAWPSWLESNFLSTIKLIGLYRCMGTKMLPSLGQLPLLQDLCISNLTAVRIIGLEFYGNGRFPSLENLETERLTSLEEWSYPGYLSVFPKLKKLKIKGCLMVELDNDFVASEYLEISSFYRLEYMSTLFQGDISTFKKLTKLEVSCCPVLITFQGLHELASLQRFYISNCDKLLFLLEMELFYSLEFFAITDCPELRSFPKKGLPVSLQILWIGGDVHHDLKEQIQSKKGRDWDKIAAISGCDLYFSVDQGKFI